MWKVYRWTACKWKSLSFIFPKDSILNKCPSLVAILHFQSTHKKKLVRGRRYECENLRQIPGKQNKNHLLFIFNRILYLLYNVLWWQPSWIFNRHWPNNCAWLKNDYSCTILVKKVFKFHRKLFIHYPIVFYVNFILWWRPSLFFDKILPTSESRQLGQIFLYVYAYRNL